MTGKRTTRPLVSIISPFYNVENYIDRFLTMVRIQTLENIEIILVDDCGSDGSYTIAKMHANQDSRIRILKNKCNIGLGPARNAGIPHATGMYLAFPDTDDWMDADFYETLYLAARENGFPDIVKGACAIDANKPLGNSSDFLNTYIKQGLDEGRPLYTLFTTQHWTAIYQRRLFDKQGVRFGNTRSSEDNVFLLRACHTASAFALSEPSARYHYNHRIDSISTTYDEARYHSEESAFAEQVDYLLDHIEPGEDRENYIVLQTGRFFNNTTGNKVADFAYKQAYPHGLADQLRRIPDINDIAARRGLIANVLSNIPRSLDPPDQPFFSIIVPVRNMESTIACALESILVQSFDSYEVIVVANDCSDRTVDIAKEHAARYPQIRVIERLDPGVSQARNTGIEAARGRYTVFLDADDFYLSGALEVMARALESHPCDILFTQQGWKTQVSPRADTNEVDPALMHALIDERPGAIPPEGISSAKNWPSLFGQWGKAYRTAFLRDNHLQCDPRLVAVEDRLFNSHACAKAKTACMLHAQVYYYAYKKHRSQLEGVGQLRTMAKGIQLFLDDWCDMGLDSEQAGLMYATGTLRIMDIKIQCCDDGECLAWYQQYLGGNDARRVLHAMKTDAVLAAYLEEFMQHRPLLADALARMSDKA